MIYYRGYVDKMILDLIRDSGFVVEEEEEPEQPVMNEEGTVSDEDDGDADQEEVKDNQHILEVRRREEQYPERMKTRQS